LDWYATCRVPVQHTSEELKTLGYVADYRWDEWRIFYIPGPVWRGEQLRRESGKARKRPEPIKAVKRDDIATRQIESCDPLLPALAAFASGLPVGEKRIKTLGLTVEQATTLCEEKQLPICNR
jgi:hypothetical protein